MAGKRGRPKGFIMPEEHRSKIRITQLLNRLCDLAEGKIPPESMPAHAVTAALGVLRKALPDLASQEIAITQDQPYARIPAVVPDAKAWTAAFDPNHSETEH